MAEDRRRRWRKKAASKHPPMTQCLMIGCKDHTGVLPSGRRLTNGRG